VTESVMSRGLFVTGTDTGVGKTVVTAGIARTLRNQGHAVTVCKPVATGAREIGERLVSDDGLALAEAAGEADPAVVTPFVFPDPVAPTVAARRQGIALTLTMIAGVVRRRQRPDSVLLVEGIGGLLCPLTDDATVADLAVALRFPLILVARLGLGTLNHTLLTLEAARRRGLRLAGVVLNQTTESVGLAEETNLAELERLKVPVLAVLPHRPDDLRAATAPLVGIGWWSLCDPLNCE
jgi:dethiobiotin synthetase